MVGVQGPDALRPRGRDTDEEVLEMDSAFKRRCWIWDDEREEPVELNTEEATREQLLEALENTRREAYELHMDLSRELGDLQRRVEVLEGAEPVDPAARR